MTLCLRIGNKKLLSYFLASYFFSTFFYCTIQIRALRALLIQITMHHSLVTSIAAAAATAIFCPDRIFKKCFWVVLLVLILIKKGRRSFLPFLESFFFLFVFISIDYTSILYFFFLYFFLSFFLFFVCFFVSFLVRIELSPLVEIGVNNERLFWGF